MKQLIIVIIGVLCFNIQGYAQEENHYKTDGLHLDGEYLEFINASIDFYSSYDYSNRSLLLDEFTNKLLSEEYESARKLSLSYVETGIRDVEDLEIWINEHLSETKFSSVEEAVELFKEYREAAEKIREEHDKLVEQSLKFEDKYGFDFMKNYRYITNVLSANKITEIKKERMLKNEKQFVLNK